MKPVAHIIPPSLRLVADVAREARDMRCKVRILRNCVVMLPRKAANQNFPEAA